MESAVGDRVSSFTITFDGEAGTVNSVLANLKSQLKSDVADIQATASRIELFKNADQNLNALRDASLSARQRVVELGQAIANIQANGGKVPEDLAKSMALAEKAATSTSKAYNAQAVQVDKLRASLSAAGVDLKNLTAEQQRLATAADVAAAKQALQFKTLKDVQPQVDRLKAAFQTLATSGKLSATETIIAQQQLAVSIKNVTSQVTQLGSVSKSVDLFGFLKNSILPALGFVGVIASVGTAFKAAIEASSEYRNSLGELGALTNLTDDDLDKLGSRIREVARDLGFDLTEALTGVQELLRSGVPKENVIDVLRVSAEAARAAFTDLGSGVKASRVLLSTFGVSLSELPATLDKILKVAKEGGPSLKEFADNGASLGNVVRAANVDFDSLLATLAVLTEKEGNAEQAFGDLTKIITKLNTSAVRENLRALGIDTGNLVDIFTKLGEKGVTLNDALNLGLTSKKSAAAIAALTANAGDLLPKLDAIAASAGSSSAALQRFLETPAGRSAKFNAEMRAAAVTLGDLFGSGSRLAQLGTLVVGGLNRIVSGFKNASNESVLAGESFNDYLERVLRIDQASADASMRLQLFGKATGDLTDRNDRLAASLANAATTLSDYSGKLAEDVQALQAAATRDIGDIDARANAQIAALDKTRAAIATSAAMQQDIEQKAAAARLAVIQKSEADISAALDKEVAARTALARKNGLDETKIATDAAQARIAALAPVLQQYQQHYAGLIQQAQRYAAQVETIDRSRVEIQRTIEQEIKAVRLEGLSGLDQYVERNKQIDDLISKGRAAAAQGDIETAKSFYQQAIEQAKGFAKVIDENGVTVVSQLQATTAKTDALKKVADAVNQSFGDQGDAAKKGLDKTKEAITAVQTPLQDLRDRYDELKRVVGEGLQLKLQMDEKSVSDALAVINNVAQDRIVTIQIRTVSQTVESEPTPTSSTGGGNGEQFARGGMVGVRGFAGGGSVFQRPPWSKVPGIGSTDTVPALLNQGSFVVRKSASEFYGDTLMRKIAGGYALGGSVGFGLNGFKGFSSGTVTKDQVKQYAESKWGFDPFSSSVYDPGGIGNAPGRSGDTAPDTDPRLGFRSGDTFQDKFEQRTISLDTRPIPAALITAANVIQYAKEMLNSVGQNNPLLGSLGPSLLNGISRLEQSPGNQTLLTAVLQSAETIGANPYLFAMWGKTTSSNALQQPEWFIDWLTQRGLVGADGTPTGATTTGATSTGTGPGSLPAFAGTNIPASNIFANRFFGQNLPANVNNFALQFFKQAIPAAGPPPMLLDLINSGKGPTKRFAQPFEGGGDVGGDSVPAMLTPGEFVVSKPAVDRVGAPLLWAINEMRLPKADLSHLLEPPRMARFAIGGMVSASGSTASVPSGGVAAGASVTTVNLNVSAADVLSEANIRRYFVPVWDSIQRRARAKRS